ncbi:DinB family protein [Flavivirga abyssicola]|uniref:DinB family protein n=1 Tax=Flavivirga abyssicola TaxID=3063533 RepID=UPI0026DEEF56|nr:DinB family protein [Flavivirga sp. MEBiC07777]WVK12057.1 DinB family protein [Flavivirga sp. MEBiC07777]
MIIYANDQFDKLLTFINDVKETSELTEKLIDVLNHNAHHRGQMTTYLRMKGITPPSYR